MIVVAKRGRQNKDQLAIENLILNKTAMAKVTKMSSVIDLGNKYSQTISNTNLNITKDLRLTNIKKYQRCAD